MEYIRVFVQLSQVSDDHTSEWEFTVYPVGSREMLWRGVATLCSDARISIRGPKAPGDLYDRLRGNPVMQRLQGNLKEKITEDQFDMAYQPDERYGGPAPSYGRVQKVIVNVFKPTFGKRYIRKITMVRVDGSSMVIGGWNKNWSRQELFAAIAEWYGPNVQVEFPRETLD